MWTRALEPDSLRSNPSPAAPLPRDLGEPQFPHLCMGISWRHQEEAMCEFARSAQHRASELSRKRGLLF